jgi:hypothetical protein
MSVFSSLLQAYRVSQDVKAATAAGMDALQKGKGPIMAVDAFAKAAGSKLGDEAARELREAAKTAVEYLTYFAAGAATLAEVLEDPKITQILDEAAAKVVSAGYWAGSWKATLKVWLEAVA